MLQMYWCSMSEESHPLQGLMMSDAPYVQAISAINASINWFSVYGEDACAWLQSHAVQGQAQTTILGSIVNVSDRLIG
jgi:hypothetical protein